MADSVTHKEFFQKQNKQQKEEEMSPIDTETTLEDMQESIIQVQDSLKLLTNKTIQDRVNHYKAPSKHHALLDSGTMRPRLYTM